MSWRCTAVEVLLFLVLCGGPVGTAVGQDPEDEYAVLLAQAQNNLDKGEVSSAESGFQELIDASDEGPVAERPRPEQVIAARAGLLAIDFRRGRYEQVRDAIDAMAEAARSAPSMRGLLARSLRALGAYEDAGKIWQLRIDADAGDFEARCERGEIEWAAGRRTAARAIWQRAADAAVPEEPLQQAWHARCRWRLGGPEQVLAASQELVAALAAAEGQSKGKDLLPARVTLGVLRFQVYGETRGLRSGEKDLRQVIEKHGDVEEALLWLYRLRSSNFQLDGSQTDRYLQRVLAQNPRCVAGIVLRGASVLDDRRYRDAGEILDGALAIDPRDKDALAHRAAVAFLQHDEKLYQQLRARALAGDAGQSDVDRILGDHLLALYRFADAQPFFDAAIAADQKDIDALHGKAKSLIYTGHGEQAKELLLRAKDLEPGYVDPWRINALAVQSLLDEQYVPVEDEHFRVQFHRDDEEVLREYLMPLCLQALDVLGKKYDYRPTEKVKVEVFHTWDDFSVRTIGFRGFTALGACFGPFITMVSPGDGDLRKQDFMWVATVWHEYTHVLTLGLSKHRVPRWLTEGFSVHEEKARDPAWERGMDRELFDAWHNEDIPPVRLLNRLFRGERILFGYYQGGLIVDFMQREFGFDKAIALLRAFGEDLDTEEAFQQALGIASSEFDRRFLEWIDREKIRGMRLVPHFDEGALQRLLVRCAKDPDNLQVHVDLAWAYLQRNDPVDAGPHLAQVLAREPEHGGALLVRAAMQAERGGKEEAVATWQRAFATGADDFDSRIHCGRVLLELGQKDDAEQMFQRAKACWPGCTEQENAPELLLAKLYRDTDRRDQALMEMKSYCKRTARAYTPRWTLAAFERDLGDRAAEARYLEECSQIDPFRRELHELLGSAYEALGRGVDAAREYEVGAAVPPSLDRRYLTPDTDRPAAGDAAERADRARLWLMAARLRHAAGDDERARSLLERIQKEADDSEAAAAARGLLEEWRRR